MKRLLFTLLGTIMMSSTLLAQNFTLKSNELGGQLANKHYLNGMGYTGENQSPQLYWEDAPEGTKSFAVTIYDMDAPTGLGFYHWGIFNIPANITELKSGAGDLNKSLSPQEAIQIKNDYGVAGYGGAAPNAGPAHRYIITVYALNKPLDLDKNTTPAYLGFNLHFASLAQASLLVYGKKK